VELFNFSFILHKLFKTTTPEYTFMKVPNKVPSKKEDVFVRQQYGKVGNHSVVKICGWTKKHIRCGANCYKHHFYGISTGRCLEMSPILICNQRCKHCWRDQSLFANQLEKFDEPKDIIKGCMQERTRLLIGFQGNEKIDQKELEKCMIPKQAAISLTGEPCLYPKLPELVTEFYNQNFDSVFLVTNGTKPEMIKKLSQLERPPTNIYLSIEAWDEQSYLDFCRPFDKKQWLKIQESMDSLKKIKEENKTTTVLRITCVKNFNLDKVKEFKWIINKLQPTYIECKGYMHVGYSQKRLERTCMPQHDEVKEFAEKLAQLTGYKIQGEQKESWVVLLGKD